MNRRHRWFLAGLDYYVLSLLLLLLILTSRLDQGRSSFFISTARSLDLLSYALVQLICRDPAGVIGHIPLQSVTQLYFI